MIPYPVFLFAPANASPLLTINLQQNNSNNLWIGLIFMIAGLALFFVFWRWWNSVSEEDTAVDLRTRNAPIIYHGGRTAVINPFYHGAPEAAGDETHGDDHGHHEEDHHAAASHAEPEHLSPGDVVPDDLTKIEGIGPKIAELLQQAGFVTFTQVSQTETSQLQHVLDAAGAHFKLADPSTWPQQAQLAAAGKWEELQAYQDSLRGGRVTE